MFKWDIPKDFNYGTRVPEEDYTELASPIVSVGGHNALMGHASTPRLVMDANHIAQHQVLVNPHKKESLISGVEYELGKYIDDVRVERDCKVIGSTQKLQGSPHNPETVIFVEYEEDGHIFFDTIYVPTYRSKHSYFGYTLHPTETMLNLSYGTMLREGDILATASALHDDGIFKYGFNANVVYSSDPATGEDGFVVSRSFLKQLDFEVVETNVFDITVNNFMINLYGKDGVFQVLPKIGEEVKNGELLAAIRERDDYHSIVDLNEVDISRVDHQFDKKCYTELGSKVVNVKVFKGNSNKTVFSENMVEQIEGFFNDDMIFAKSIFSQYQRQMGDIKRQFGANVVPRLSQRMTCLVTEARTLMETMNTRKRLAYGTRPIDQYRIEVTTKTTVRPNLGFKITGLFGDKGTFTDIREDKDMPYVPGTGIRADIIAGGLTETISRMNIGRILEGYMGAANRDNRLRLIGYFQNKYGSNYIHKLKDVDYQFAKHFLVNYYKMINPRMVEYIESYDQDDLESHIHEVLEEALYMEFPTDNVYNVVDVIECIEETDYKPIYERIKYTHNGQEFYPEKPIRINRTYFMLLDRTARDVLAVASSKVNNYLIPIKGPSSAKKEHQHSQTPITSLSETEAAITAAYSPDLLAELYDINLNPSSHRSLVKDIVVNGGMYNPNFDVDRESIEYGGARVVKLLNHIVECSGLGLEYMDDESDDVIVEGE